MAATRRRGAGLVALVAVAAVNPDRFIADRNVERYLRTNDLDVAYLSTLSADAVPALQRLPPGVRAVVLRSTADRLDRTPDDWRSWNLGRARARRAIAR